MKVLRCISLILIIMFSTTCTKFGKNVTVKGKVIDPITGEPFSEVKAQLLVSESLQLPGGFKEIKSTYTDSEGKFELSAGRTKTVYVQVQIPSNTYALGWYENGEHTSTSVKEVDKGKVMNVEYHLVPYGEYQLIVNNINCQGPSDTIIINQQNQVGSFLDSDWILTGCDGYTTSFSEAPMGNIYIDWTVIRGGVSESFSDTVFLEEGENLSYEINY